MKDAHVVAGAIRAANIEASVVHDYGWPGQIELALIDSVMSIRAKYGTETTGVLGRVLAYRRTIGGRSADSLPTLAQVDPHELAALLGAQRSSGRLKAEICLDVAERLVNAGVLRAADINPDSEAQRRAWTGTFGLGWVTWEYFTMLLGHPGVKADTMIRSFVSDSLGVADASPTRAHAAVTGAANLLGVEARDLDHAIWRHQSGRGVRR